LPDGADDSAGAKRSPLDYAGEVGVVEINRAANVQMLFDEIKIGHILDVKADIALVESLISTVAGASTESEGNEESTEGKGTHEKWSDFLNHVSKLRHESCEPFRQKTMGKK
jgi:hypothetical protein